MEQKAKPKSRRRRRPGFEMRISTKYAPRKIAEGQPRSCITGSSLTEGQMLELYRYLKLTRLVEERIVNLYRQTKVVGGVYRSLGFIGPISHLGDMIPVMTGILLGARMQQKDIVGLAYIGDGGASTGAFYEGMNFAAVQRLPLVVIVESNHYAYSTPTNMQTAVRNLAEKAAAFGIPGYIVDGNDVIACYEVTKQAIKHARAGQANTPLPPRAEQHRAYPAPPEQPPGGRLVQNPRCHHPRIE